MNMNTLIKTCGLTATLVSSLALFANSANAATNQAYISTNAAGITEITVDNTVVNAMLGGQAPNHAAQPRGAALLVEDVVNYNGIARAYGMQNINGQMVLVNPINNGQMIAMAHKNPAARID